MLKKIMKALRSKTIKYNVAKILAGLAWFHPDLREVITEEKVLVFIAAIDPLIGIVLRMVTTNPLAEK